MIHALQKAIIKVNNAGVRYTKCTIAKPKYTSCFQAIKRPSGARDCVYVQGHRKRYKIEMLNLLLQFRKAEIGTRKCMI